MNRVRNLGVLLLVAFGLVAASPAPAVAQREAVDCGSYQGVVCQGYFTDEVGVVDDPQRIEDAISRVVGNYGNPIAVVVVQDSRGANPADFAADLANAWGVGDPAEEDGILVLVSLDERRTEVVTQENISVPGSAIAGSARSFFSAGDFEGGLLAIVGAVEQSLAGNLTDDTDDSTGIPFGYIIALGIAGFFVFSVVGQVVSKRRTARKMRRKERERLIDGDLAGLEPSGADLPRYADFAIEAPAPTDVATSDAVKTLWQIASGSASDETALTSLWSLDLIDVIDRDRLIGTTREPLELRASEERPILENAVQQAADAALSVDIDDATFASERRKLERLIASLRPHRVAAARRRTGDALLAELTPTPIGNVVTTTLGAGLVEAAPGFPADAPLSASVAEYRAALSEADAKVQRLEDLYERLPQSTARPAIAAALADLEDNTDSAVSRYESVRKALDAKAAGLTADGLDPAAIAALLLMNRNEANTQEFLDAYQGHRDRGFGPAEAVEFALAGLMTDGEVRRARAITERLDLPISITVGLLNRRDDGPEVYEQLRDELAAYTTTESARTIAGVLAMSLEPSQALRRWLEARSALHELGLVGSYADVAAAFGASDPRGPRRFAVAYAAQRRALADSSIDDADRFAPELAHAGTSGQQDSWSGRPIPGGIGSFDPFTFFFHHWVITRGVSDSFGWEPIYRDASWSQDRGSWWGGGGGFGSSGGSSWGGSSWSGGSFGGFGGGGGFSSGGGGGW